MPLSAGDRDLKPANVRIRRDGTVKVRDFGLAKALEPAGERTALANSPTLTNRATAMGVILGTAAWSRIPHPTRPFPVSWSSRTGSRN
jgi:serine/threonine protein kinase